MNSERANQWRKIGFEFTDTPDTTNIPEMASDLGKRYRDEIGHITKVPKNKTNLALWRNLTLEPARPNLVKLVNEEKNKVGLRSDLILLRDYIKHL